MLVNVHSYCSLSWIKSYYKKMILWQCVMIENLYIKHLIYWIKSHCPLKFDVKERTTLYIVLVRCFASIIILYFLYIRVAWYKLLTLNLPLTYIYKFRRGFVCWLSKNKRKLLKKSVGKYSTLSRVSFNYKWTSMQVFLISHYVYIQLLYYHIMTFNTQPWV